MDLLTKHLQDRDKILSLGDRAISSSPNSGPAARELVNLWKTSPDGSLREAARGELARIRIFWGNGTGYLSPAYRITSLNGKPVTESALTTCELLASLRSPDWRDRARSATLLARSEKGVPDALMHAMADDYSEVAACATRSLLTISGVFDMEMFPDANELETWWAKEGPGITARLKDIPCAGN